MLLRLRTSTHQQLPQPALQSKIPEPLVRIRTRVTQNEAVWPSGVQNPAASTIF